jgi:hypothetical protein
MSASLIRILIFDSNRVFANRLRDLALEIMPNVYIETAWNTAVLRSRLEQQYQVILADVDNYCLRDEVLEILKTAKTPVFLWALYNTAIHKKDDMFQSIYILRKPVYKHEVGQLFSRVVGAGKSSSMLRSVDTVSKI